MAVAKDNKTKIILYISLILLMGNEFIVPAFFSPKSHMLQRNNVLFLWKTPSLSTLGINKKYLIGNQFLMK